MLLVVKEVTKHTSVLVQRKQNFKGLAKIVENKDIEPKIVFLTQRMPTKFHIGSKLEVLTIKPDKKVTLQCSVRIKKLF